MRRLRKRLMIKVTRTSIVTGKKTTLKLDITPEIYFYWVLKRKVHIQTLMPNLTADEREFLISGLAPGEYDKLYRKK